MSFLLSFTCKVNVIILYYLNYYSICNLPVHFLLLLAYYIENFKKV